MKLVEVIDYPAGSHMFKINNRNTIARCKIFSLKYARIVLVSLWLTLNILTPCCSASNVNFEQLNVDWLMLNINIY